jgi:hypothetical protein
MSLELGELRAGMEGLRERDMLLRLTSWRVTGVRTALLWGLCSWLHASTAQAANTTAPSPDERDKVIDQLLQRVESLEKEVRDLRSGGSSSAVGASGVNGPGEEAPRPTFPELTLRGFGDVAYYWSDQKDVKNTFALGQLDLFITSQLAENVSVLNENVIEAGGENNEFRFEIERLLLQYAPFEFLKLGVGRYHTSVGYYNTAYHHGTWFQTATGRPYLFQFEDDGGPLPIHNVGVTANGRVPSGKLNLQYVVEVGNGRDYNPGSEPVLNVQDNNGYKAVNLAVKLEPEWVPGLQTGISAYHDRVDLEAQPRIDQWIFAGYAVYARPPWEWLNEGVLFRHDDSVTGTHWTPAFYTQLARQFGPFRPYVRFEYVNAPDADPIFAVVGRPGLLFGPSVGLRYDFTQYACLKVQYDHRIQQEQPSVNGVTVQVGYTF